MRLNASLCVADELLSDTEGRVGRTTGIGHPAFRDFVRQVTRALFPFPLRPERNSILLNAL